jgi:hypothetical protein
VDASERFCRVDEVVDVPAQLTLRHTFLGHQMLLDGLYSLFDVG